MAKLLWPQNVDEQIVRNVHSDITKKGSL